jgi:hypothetical protein
MAEISEQRMVEEVERRLADKYADVPAERISAIVQSAYAQFEQSPIRDFVPLLVERRARAELAEAQITNPRTVPAGGLNRMLVKST